MSSTRDGLEKTGEAGLFYREHDSRRHGVKHDRQWVIRQTLGGKTRISILGWMSEGYLLGDALNKVAEYKSNHSWNLANPDQPPKPACQADEKEINEQKAEDNPPFKEFAKRFILQYCKKKLRDATAREYERQIKSYLLPVWGQHRVAGIQRKQIVKLVEKMSDTAPVQANRTLATIKKMFSYAFDVGLVEVNPASRVKPPAKEIPRDRVLDMGELVTLFKKLDTLPNLDTSDFLQLIALTAQRPGEVAGMRLKQLRRDNEGLWLELSGGLTTKNGDPQRIFLNAQAEKIIQRRIDDLKPKTFLFPARTKSGYTEIGTMESRTRKLQPLESVEYFTPHDLRRSAVTGMARIGYGALADDLLNHKQQGISRRVYDLYDRGPEIKAALTAWGEAIQRAIDGGDSNIISISQNQ